MNQVNLIGRLTKDPDIRYAASSQMAVARFSIAIDRGKDRNGKDQGADFPNIVCFGKTAELVEKFCSKGMLVGITGRIQTGSYEKDGRKVYTVDIVADRVGFLSKKGDSTNTSAAGPMSDAQNPFDGFTADIDDIPF